MKTRTALAGVLIPVLAMSIACLTGFPTPGGYGTVPDERWEQNSRLVQLAAELDRRADDVVRIVSGDLLDRGGTLNDDEIAVLFASEGFSSAARLFSRLTERGSGYAARGSSRSVLNRSFRYLVREFNVLDSAVRRTGIRNYILADCDSTLRRVDDALGGSGYLDEIDRNRAEYGPDVVGREEMQDWNGKYAKGRGAAVYLIESRGAGEFIRRPFKNLESLFKYNYDRDRGKNPWGYVAEIPIPTLERMRQGTMIDRTFEGAMIIEPETRPNRPVYLIRGGKKLPLSRADLVARYGGWSKVFEVPREVIDAYPEGETIK